MRGNLTILEYDAPNMQLVAFFCCHYAFRRRCTAIRPYSPNGNLQTITAPARRVGRDEARAKLTCHAGVTLTVAAAGESLDLGV